MIPHRLYFVRHGETDWNAEGRLQGQRDIPLNDLGRVQAEECGRLLADLHERPEDLAFFASPLSRTAETMEILRATLGLHPASYHREDRLKELAFGQWEGMTWEEVQRRDPAGARRREQDKWFGQPPEGESYEMLAERLAPFLPMVTRHAVVVSHGGVGRTLMAMIGGLPKRQAATTYVRQGVVYVFEKGGFRLVDSRKPR